MRVMQLRRFAEVWMKLYGYEDGAVDRHAPTALSEVTVMANAEEIRAIARLLADIANEMDRSDFGHVHLNDRISGLEDCPHLIVVKANR
jgi:hypothetical protein